MKKIVLYFLFVAVAAIFVSCKYEEGPFISFRDAEERIVGYWKLADVYVNGEPADSTAILPNRPGNFYSFFIERMISLTALDGTIWYESVYGGWEFENKNKELYVAFTLKNKKYEYTAVIKRLTRDELVYEYDDENGDHWRLEFDSRSSMYY